MKTYDFRQTTIICNFESITGFAEGTAILFEAEAERYNSTVDLNSQTSRFAINNNNAKLTLTLTQASISNDTFSRFYNLDKLSNTGAFSLALKDNNGTTLITTDKAWVQALPNVGFGSENVNREWVLMLADVNLFAGGIN